MSKKNKLPSVENSTLREQIEKIMAGGANNPKNVTSIEFTQIGIQYATDQILKLIDKNKRIKMSKKNKHISFLYGKTEEQEVNYFYEDCGCELCELIHEILMSGEAHTYPFVWADPRRRYSESAEDFIRRVPDGFIKFPENHKHILRQNHPHFLEFLRSGYIDESGLWL